MPFSVTPNQQQQLNQVKQQYQENHSKPRVIIVGAGLAGLCLSLGLSRRGFHVDLIEKSTEFKQRGTALALAPNAFKALQEVVGFDPDDGDDPNNAVDSSSLLRQIHDLSFEGSFQRRLTPWWTLRDCLLHQVHSQNEDITIHMGMQISDIFETDSDGVSVRFENDPNLILRGDLLIGADGVFSQVRKYLDLDPPTFVGTTVWRGHVNLRDSTTAASTTKKQEFTPLGSLLNKGILPLGVKMHGNSYFSVFNFHSKIPGILSWVATTTTNLENDIQEKGKKQITPEEVILPNVKDENERNLIRLLLQASDVDSLKRSYKMHIHTLPRVDHRGWGGRGRVTIIGDAAHALRPSSGQGAAMAFEDCAVLCRLLSPEKKKKKEEEQQATTLMRKNGTRRNNILKDAKTCEHLLKRFEKERLPRVRTISDAETEEAVLAYRGTPMQKSKEYLNWLYNGI